MSKMSSVNTVNFRAPQKRRGFKRKQLLWSIWGQDSFYRVQTGSQVSQIRLQTPIFLFFSWVAMVPFLLDKCHVSTVQASAINKLAIFCFYQRLTPEASPRTSSGGLLSKGAAEQAIRGALGIYNE
jgi:hypothetical protein